MEIGCDVIAEWFGEDYCDVTKAQFGDYVYFTAYYDAGNVFVMPGTDGIIRSEHGATNGCHIVGIDIEDKLYEIEVPFDVLAME